MQESLVLLAMGAVNGLIHALDADHVVAVTTLAARGESRRLKLLATSLHWALGHGLALLLICLAVLVFGLTLPGWLAPAAEGAVGLVLILVGLSVLRRFLRDKSRFSVHRHDVEGPGHLHLHGSRHVAEGGPSPDHRPVLVGLVHGAAGSAPLLAMLPLMVRQHFLDALVYILLFCASVALMMCVCGGLLGKIFSSLQVRFAYFASVAQFFLGFLSIGLGIFWLAS